MRKFLLILLMIFICGDFKVFANNEMPLDEDEFLDMVSSIVQVAALQKDVKKFGSSKLT